MVFAIVMVVIVKTIFYRLSTFASDVPIIRFIFKRRDYVSLLALAIIIFAYFTAFKMHIILHKQ
jgi:hypothetical protein